MTSAQAIVAAAVRKSRTVERVDRFRPGAAKPMVPPLALVAASELLLVHFAHRAR